jgi:hypothetical protein
MFQSTVNRNFTQGFAGEIANDGPIRSIAARITSVSLGADTITTNHISRAYTWSGEVSTGPSAGNTTQSFLEGTVQVGGTTAYAGILINPKHYALYGSATTGGQPLAPSYDLPQYSEGEFCNMGILFAEIFNDTASAKTVNYGDLVFFVNAAVPNTVTPIPVGALVTYPTVTAANASVIGTAGLLTQIANGFVKNPTSLAAGVVGAPGTGNAPMVVTKIELTQ